MQELQVTKETEIDYIGYVVNWKTENNLCGKGVYLQYLPVGHEQNPYDVEAHLVKFGKYGNPLAVKHVYR